MKYNCFLFLVCLFILSGCSSQKLDNISIIDSGEYLILKKTYENSWIDREIEIFLYDSENKMLSNVYLDALKDVYLLCVQEKKYYISSNYYRRSIDSVSYKDVNYFSSSNLSFPKNHSFIIKKGNTTYEIYKVNIFGCHSSWKDIGRNSKENEDVILPFEIKTIKLNKKEKNFFKLSTILNNF